MRVYLSRDADSVAVSDALHEAGLAEVDMSYTQSEGFSVMVPDKRFLSVIERVDSQAGTTPPAATPAT